MIGSSIAYHLSCRRVGVLLLEKNAPASGTSGACDGAVLLQSKKPGIHLELALASVRRFSDLARDLPYPIQFKSNGSLVVIRTQAELEVMKRLVERQNQGGLAVTLLDGKQTRELEPSLSEQIVGAAFSTVDGQVNPIRLNLAFTLGARQNGARVSAGEEVVGIEVEGGRVRSVVTSKGVYSSDTVVVAAGVGAPEIGKTIGLNIPIKPRRGQILVSEAVDPFVGRNLVTANYIAAKFDPAIARQGNQGVSIDQTAKGNFLLGSTREFVGYDRRTTWEAMARIAHCACEIIPRLSGLNIIRSFAGLRPYTPDGLPLLGPVGRIKGLFLAAGHEGDGIALSPITGALIADVICGQKTELPLDAFRCDRFSEEK